MTQHGQRSLLLVMMTLSIGARGGTPDGTDGGADAPIVVPDAGPADAFVAADTGDGICGDNFDSTSWGPLPASCLPRCTAATRAVLATCTSSACVDAATAADTTPSVRVRSPTGVWTIACGHHTGITACTTWQVYSCLSQWCATEFDTWTACVNTGSACTNENNALQACATASSDYASCSTDRVDACFEH